MVTVVGAEEVVVVVLVVLKLSLSPAAVSLISAVLEVGVDELALPNGVNSAKSSTVEFRIDSMEKGCAAVACNTSMALGRIMKHQWLSMQS